MPSLALARDAVGRRWPKASSRQAGPAATGVPLGKFQRPTGMIGFALAGLLEGVDRVRAQGRGVAELVLALDALADQYLVGDEQVATSS